MGHCFADDLGGWIGPWRPL